MKQILLGLIIGVAVALPVGAIAEQLDVSTTKWTKQIYRFNRGCEDNSSGTVGETCGKVDVFDDQDNKCYVAYSTVEAKSVAISCVKR